jgi:hypothetical protein
VLSKNIFIAAAMTALATLPVLAWAQKPAAPAVANPSGVTGGAGAPAAPTVVPAQPSAPTPPSTAPGKAGAGTGAAAGAGAPAAPAVTPTQPSAPAPPPVAVAGTTAPDPGIVEVPLDLASRTVKQVLPFDVPFHFAGIVPGGVAQIELQYMESRAAIVVTTIPTACGDPTIQVSTSDPKASGWQPKYPSTWTYSPLLDQSAPVKFILSVPALEAQRYDLFKLRIVSTVTTDSMNAIAQQARSLFDKTLDQVPRGTSILPDRVEQIRQDLITNVKAALGADRVIAPGTLFDPCLDGLPAAGTVKGQFLGLLRVVVESQDAINDNLKNLRGSREVLRNALNRIATNQPLQELLLRLELAAKSDPAIALFLQTTGVASLAADNLSATEQALLGPELPPPGSTAAAVAGLNLTSLGQSYDTTQKRLGQLRVSLKVLAHPISANPSSPEQRVTEADRQVITALLDKQPATQGDLTLAEGAAQQLPNEAAQLMDALDQRNGLLDDLAKQIAAKARVEVVADATTTGNADTFQRYFITADLGFLYSWDVAKLVPYVGTNIYFRPVNPNVPLSQKGGPWRRFSVTLGYTLQGIGDNGRTRKDLFGGGSLVAGAGFRVTESIRLAAGALIFIRENSNPLITEERVTASPYLSISFDWKIAKTFAVLGQTFFSSVPSTRP